MQLLESKTGSESHSSAWGKLYIHGIELVVEDRQRDNHHLYNWGAAQVEDGKIFTIWNAEGDKRGTSTNDYYICVTDSTAAEQKLDGGCYGKGGWVKGRWTVLAHGDGPVRAPRLLEWVKAVGGIEKVDRRLAEHLGAQIKLRGVKSPAPLPELAVAAPN